MERSEMSILLKAVVRFSCTNPLIKVRTYANIRPCEKSNFINSKRAKVLLKNILIR